MEFVNFRSEDELMVMVLNEEADFTVLIESIKDRLIMFKEHNIEHPQSMKIELGQRVLQSAQLLQLFDTIIEAGVTLIEGIDSAIPQNVEIAVHEGTLRAGQNVFFENSVMVLGDINPGAVLNARYNVYVVGKIRGKVAIKSKEGRIVASNYKNCVIQIFDSEPTIIEQLEGNIIDYADGSIRILEGYSQGGKVNGKNYSSNIR